MKLHRAEALALLAVTTARPSAREGRFEAAADRSAPKDLVDAEDPPPHANNAVRSTAPPSRRAGG